MFVFKSVKKREKNSLKFVELIIVLVVFILTAHDLYAAEQKKINIDVTTHLGDLVHFADGDNLFFLISLDQDAYLTVVYQNAEGDILQLIPNKNQQNRFYKSGLFIQLPGADSNFRFIIQAPFGQESLWVFASDLPSPELKGQYYENGLKKLTGTMDSIRKTLAMKTELAYGETRLLLYTHARK